MFLLPSFVLFSRSKTSRQCLVLVVCVFRLDFDLGGVSLTVARARLCCCVGVRPLVRRSSAGIAPLSRPLYSIRFDAISGSIYHHVRVVHFTHSLLQSQVFGSDDRSSCQHIGGTHLHLHWPYSNLSPNFFSSAILQRAPCQKPNVTLSVPESFTLGVSGELFF